MTTAARRTLPQRTRSIPPLYIGDRLSQPEFHRRYEAYDGDKKWELIGGIVYMASPQRIDHSKYEPKLSTILCLYEEATPGVEVLSNATSILSEESEPQPDLALRIMPDYGGQSRNKKRYVVGAPELVAEIAHSSVAIDMGRKKDDYEQTGVREYVVLCVEEKELFWFDFESKGQVPPNAQGIYQSRIFPGFWIDGPALIARRLSRLLKVLNQGLAGPEHAEFVKRLATARHKRKSK
jgi:Uma2 family endonuclease